MPLSRLIPRSQKKVKVVAAGALLLLIALAALGLVFRQSQTAVREINYTQLRELAETGVKLGGYVSFSGILTFPKSQELRDIARDVPAERLLVETDAPYLAPVPFRGKRNEPAWVAHTAKVLAQVRGATPEAIADLTTANFRRLFPKAA